MHQSVMTVAGAYWVCSSCGQLHLDSPESDQGDHYDVIWSRQIEGYAPSERDFEECRRWLDRIEPYRQRGRLYEVGTGLGLLLKSAADAGWQPAGIELSPLAASFAAEQSGAKVDIGAIEDIELEPDVYDVVLCNNVFEHLREPRRVLNNLARSLRPGGVIFFQTLSAQSLSVWFAPTTWLYFGISHLYIPTLKSLDFYFRAAGVRAIRSETHGFRRLPWSHDPKNRGRRKSRVDKLMSNVASSFGRGHRVKMLLRKEESQSNAAASS